ncbi:MAG: hypothetical protein ACI849_000985 [Patiriisocius sp.]
MKHTLSILLSLLLLISNTGIAYAQHFCGEYEMMAKVTFGQKKLSCGMAMEQDDCDEAQENEEHSCCSNQYTQVDVDDTIAQTAFEYQISSVFDDLRTPSYSIPSEILILQKEIVYIKYNPPPLIKDIPVLFETFLI